MNEQMQMILFTQQLQEEELRIEQLEEEVKELEQALISSVFSIYDIEDYIFMKDNKAEFHIPLKELHPAHLCTSQPPQNEPELVIYSANTLEAEKIHEGLQKGFKTHATEIYFEQQKSCKAILKRIMISFAIDFSKFAISFLSFILSLILLLFQLINKPKSIILNIFTKNFYIEWFPMIFKNERNVDLDNLEKSIESEIEQIESYETGGMCRAISIGIFGGLLSFFALEKKSQ